MLLRPADIVLIGYAVSVCALLALLAPGQPKALTITLIHLGVAAAILLIAAWNNRAVHAWYPVVAVYALYSQLRHLVPLLHPHDFDLALAAIDVRVLHVYPTVFLERIASPLLTEVLQICYAMYYFMPLALLYSLYRKHDERFHYVLFLLVLGFTLSYFGYFLVPAIGPRFTPEIMRLQAQPLTGLWTFSHIRGWLDAGEGITRDCFPSGHTELTIIVLISAYQMRRDLFRWIAPIGAALIFSTVYLRYHYVVDVFAGAVLGTAIVLLAPGLYRVLGKATARSKTDANASATTVLTSHIVTSRPRTRAIDVTP